MPFCGQTETQMNSYKRWNNIVGWIVFAIAAMTYLLTMEPSSSLWDCSEFIATSYKLEVGHPPGAPLFMLLARLATILAPSTYYVPHMVNAMNCLASAFCILFLFWTITHLARRILTRQGAELTKANIVAVLGTGAVGALAYTFTDTFWFSAVEGEVYALSSMFTALVVWLMLKWEEQADQPHSMRWIVLIAYLMGLSIGVHILNLLTVPALVFIYYSANAAHHVQRYCGQHPHFGRDSGFHQQYHHPPYGLYRRLVRPLLRQFTGIARQFRPRVLRSSPVGSARHGRIFHP